MIKAKATTTRRKGESGYDRIPLDAYFTEPWVIAWLLDCPRFKLGPGKVWEPACGTGILAEAVRRLGRKVIATDIASHGYEGQAEQRDFRDYDAPPDPGVKIILTNPPYDAEMPDGSKVTAEDFLRHALKLMAEVGGQVVMLLRNEFDSAASRKDLFADHQAFAGKLILTRRPYWQQRVKNGKWPRFNYAWFVWDFSRSPGAAEVAYLTEPRRGPVAIEQQTTRVETSPAGELTGACP
jgi:predicted RNA methylase